MKKLWSFGILFFLIISQFQVGVIYASELEELQHQKDISSGQLDDLGDIIETAVKKLGTKIGDEEKSQKLQKKGKEIEKYIENAQREIEAESSAKDIKEKVEKVKKIVVLKVISGVTDYENIEDSISNDVAKTQAEKLEALEISKDSLVGDTGDYAIMMRSTYGKNKFEKTLLKLDDTLILEYLHKVGKYRYYEVSFSGDSIFAKEMFEDIKLGIIPNSFIGIEIVKPEVFTIEQIKKEKNLKKNLLSGEDFTQTWGIEEYKTYRYFSESQKNSKKIKIGVVDTGIDYTHPDLEKRVAKNLGRDFVNKDRDAMDDQGHGTHVAGTIAASINKSGIIGVNPYVRLVPLKICSETGFCPTYAVIRALKYAEKKDIDILNMSLGGRSNPEGHAICDAIESYTVAGGIVVSAAGNANSDVSNFVPGGCDSVISVGAYDRSFSKAGFSNYGSNVDISAPGVDIYSTALGGGYKKLSGTSMSAPHITGVVSLMQSYQGDISSSQVRDVLKNNMNILVSPNYISGAVDFDSLISSLQGIGVEEEIIVEEVNQEQEIEMGVDEENIEGETGTREVIETPMESYVKKDTSIDDNEPWVKTGSISGPKRQTINIGDVAEILEISSGTGTIESIDIDQEVEELKQYPENIGERVFGEDGKILENPTVIQSSESLTILEANSQETQGFGDESWDEIETDFQVQEIRIDGAEKEIRVQGSENLGEIEFLGEEDKNFILQEDGSINIPIENINYLHDTEISLLDIHQNNKQQFTESGELLGENLEGYGNVPIEISNFATSENRVETDLYIASPYKITERLIINQGSNEISISNNTYNLSAEIKVGEYTGEVFDIDMSVGSGSMDEGIIFQGEPESVLDFSSIEPISRVNMGEVPEPYISEDGSESIGIQNIYTCEVELGSSCDFSFYKPSNYSFTPDIRNIAILTLSDRVISFKGQKIGQVTYIMSRSGNNYHTFVVTFIEPQVDKTYNMSLVRKETKSLAITNAIGGWYPYQSSQGGGATIQRISNGIQVTGTGDGIYTYYGQKPDQTGFSFKVVIEVTPFIPPVDTIELYVGQSVIYYYLGGHSSYSSVNQNNSNITIGASGGYNSYRITANSVGTTQAFLLYQGEHTDTLIVNVLEIPVPESHDATTLEGGDIYITLPRNGIYTFALEAGYTGYASLYDVGDQFLLRGVSPGEATYRVIENGITHYIITVKILPKEPVIIDTEMFRGQQQLHRITNGYNYTYSVTNQGVVSMQNTSKNLYITGEQVGETQIVLSVGGFPHYIINTKINTPPEPEINEIQTQELLTTNISLSPGYYRWTQEKIGNASASITYDQASGVMTIAGHVEGEINITVIDGGNLVRYILRVNIIPNPPLPQEISILETREQQIEYNYGDIYSYSQQGIIGLRQVSSVLYLQGLGGGSVELYVRNFAGRHYKTYLVTVEPKPIAQEYSIDINVKQSGEVTLPENISSYNFHIDTQTPFTDSDWDKSFQISGDRTFTFRGEQSGTSVIELRDSRNFAIYRVTIRVNIYEVDFEIIQTEERDPGLSYNDDHISDAPHIAYVSGGYDEVQAIQPGTANIKSYDDGIHHRTTHVTVIPTPDPIEINCDMYAGETCRLDYSHGGRGISYTTSRSDAFEVEYGIQTLRVKGLAVGTARVTVKARHGEYIKYIMNVNVLPQPPEIHECEIPQGTECQTKWWDDYGSYRITTTDASVVRVGLEQYSQTFADDITRKMERTVIEGLSPGTAEVYIYENQDHRYTVRMTVIDPVPPISVEDGSVTIKQGEKIKIEILSGGGDYMELEYEQDLIYFDVDTSADGLGDVDILGKNLGITYPKFRDKYYQEYQMSVKITDTTLDLNGPDTNNEFVFNDYQSQYISATNYYGDVYLSTSNSNFSVRKDVFEDGQIGFLITPIQNGETTFTFTDNEPGGVNTKTVLVKVGGGGSIDEEEDNTEVPGNLVKNPTFEGTGERTGGSYQWYDETTKGWSGMFSNAGRTKLENGRLFLETYGEGYVQTRNTKGSYHLVSQDSIKVEPNTSYIIEYDYETEYITGDSLHGFSVVVLTQEANGIGSGEFRSVPFVKTTQGVTRVKYEFTTSSNANYLNISPLIYSHTGDKTLQMKAWVDNMSLIKKDITTPIDDSQKIRYIRDWLNGSNSSTSNAWSEIEVFEKGTGINRAGGIIPTTDIISPTGSLSYLTDGIKSATYSLWTGKSSAGMLNYMQLDLGELYDIETVNITHFFTDGRTFFDTKTEVSADGVNWTTIFDSAVNGTYVETSEGRNYEVSVVGVNFEMFLEGLLLDLNIDKNINQDNIEINRYIWENENTAIEKIEQAYIDRFNVTTATAVQKANLLNIRIYNAVQSRHPDLLWSIFDIVKDLKNKYSNDNITLGILELFEYHIPNSVSDYWKKNPDEAFQKIGDINSLGVSLIPIVGEGYDITTLILGRDPITGESLGVLGKTLTLAGLLSGFGSGKAAREAGNKTLEELRNELNLSQEEIEGIALKVVKDIEVNSISDLIKFKEKLGFKAITSKIKSIVYVGRHTNIEYDGSIKTHIQTYKLDSLIKLEKSNELIIKEAFKGSVQGVFMSDIIISQLKYLDLDISAIKEITLDNVINEPVMDAFYDNGSKYLINNWGKLKGIDEMTVHLSNSLNKKIDNIEIIEILFDLDTEYSIKISLK